MASPAGLESICASLIEKYGDRGTGAAQRLRTWISGKVPLANPEALEKHLTPEHLSLLFDAFWQILPFGTGGRRGPIGYGPNRVNPSTIVFTVQGHCNYLRSVIGSGEISVVLANDVRVFNDFRGAYSFLGDKHPLIGLSSRSLAKLACEVYSANGIICHLIDPDSDTAILSTPELSFLISELATAGGINISASHNPPDDNGIKVYDQYGSQPIAPNDQLLIDSMERVTEIKRMSFAEAQGKNLIRRVSDEYRRRYVDAYKKLYGDLARPSGKFPMVFTPLCGCGLTTVGRVLPELGFSLDIPPDQGPDGTFQAIPFRTPNPEVPEATQPAKEFANQRGAGVVFSTDPDADRIGVEIKLADGSWYHCDGNQIAAMLTYFLMLDPKGPRRKGLVIETLVTTKILGKITELAGDSWIIDDLLVGFKYVGDVIKQIEQTGKYKGRACSINEFVLATEESHGVVVLPTIRDKDATPACMYLGALYDRLKGEGRTLLDYYTQILEEVGEFAEVSRSIVMIGADGVFRRDQMMSSLRQSPPRAFDGQTIRRTVDYWDEQVHGKFVSESDKLPRNVIHYVMDTFTITVRPSGTEPKLKIYCQLLPGPTPFKVKGLELMKAAKVKAESMVQAVYHELLRRIDINVGPISLLLPDIIDIGYKERFENNTVPQLVEAVNAGKFNQASEVLAWIQERVKGMLPGADPVPALKSTILYLCKQSFKSGPPALLSELEAWARS